MISLTNALSGTRAMEASLFGIVRKQVHPKPSGAAYRCTECDDEVTFNSLAMSCRCIREFYRDVAADAGPWK